MCTVQIIKIDSMVMSVRTSILAIWLENLAVEGMVT